MLWWSLQGEVFEDMQMAV